MSGPGTVLLTPSSSGSTASWLIQTDNLRQLRAAAQGEAHLAVYADMKVAGNVWRALEDTGVIPTVAPTLVAPVTHLWLFADPPGSTGLAWDPGRGWYRFSCILPGEARAQR